MTTLQSPRSQPVGTPRPTRRRADVGLVRHALSTPLASYYIVVTSSALLLGLGILMVLSASSVYAQVNTGDAYYFVRRQLTFLVVGAGIAWVMTKMSVRTLRAFSWPVLLGAVLLLVLTFIPGFRVTVNNNHNWVQFGTPLLRFQPSEFAKFAMVLWGADHLARKEKILDRPRELLPFIGISGLLVGLVVMQRDLGTAMVMALVLMAILFLVGAPLRLLLGLTLSAGLVVAGLVASSPNRMARILGFVDQSADIEGVNQQPLRAIYALASGGWTGLGLGQSKQKWGMLVEAHTDFVFAIIGEELGLVGTLAVLALFLTLGYAAFRIAMRSDDPFCRNAAGAAGAWLMLQALVNIAVVMRLAPVVGVPLPLVSYGGSSLLAGIATLGLLVRCARNEPAARKVLARRSAAARPRVTSIVGGPRT